MENDYKDINFLSDQMKAHLIKSEMFKISTIIQDIKKQGVEKYFLKEISIKSSIILTLLYSYYDLCYLLYNYVEEKYIQEYETQFTRL